MFNLHKILFVNFYQFLYFNDLVFVFSLRDNIDGYTPAMMAVYNRMKEKEEMEYEKMVVLNNNNLKIKGRNRKKVKKTKNTKPEVKFTPVKTRSAKSLSGKIITY